MSAPDDDRPSRRRSEGEHESLQGHAAPDHRESDSSPSKDPQTEKNSGQAKEKNGRAKRGLMQRPLLAGLLMLAVVALAVGATLIWIHSRDYETTDDAYIDVVSEQASAQVPGRVLKVLVDDNQDVKAGQVLVQIDPADFQQHLDQALAAEAQAEAEVAEAHAQAATAAAQAAQSRASVEASNATKANAESQLKRYQSLREARPAAVAQQQLDSSQAAALTAEAQADAAAKALQAAEAQITSARSKIQAAEAGVRSAQSQIQQARLNLSYTEVHARIDGRVSSRSVTEGNYIQAGAPLMAIVPQGVYVTANFKETQLAHMRRGQSAEVKIDSYPDLRIPAHIDSIEAATGQAFSVLPAENATGNWVKIVQRVPVKIVFDRIPDNPDERPGPGMSVEVKVSIR